VARGVASPNRAQAILSVSKHAYRDSEVLNEASQYACRRFCRSGDSVVLSAVRGSHANQPGGKGLRVVARELASPSTRGSHANQLMIFRQTISQRGGGEGKGPRRPDERSPSSGTRSRMVCAATVEAITDIVPDGVTAGWCARPQSRPSLIYIAGWCHSRMVCAATVEAITDIVPDGVTAGWCARARTYQKYRGLRAFLTHSRMVCAATVHKCILWIYVYLTAGWCARFARDGAGYLI
jgi:hypothetical protein